MNPDELIPAEERCFSVIALFNYTKRIKRGATALFDSSSCQATASVLG